MLEGASRGGLSFEDKIEVEAYKTKEDGCYKAVWRLEIGRKSSKMLFQNQERTLVRLPI